jgi:hypothetical protein
MGEIFPLQRAMLWQGSAYLLLVRAFPFLLQWKPPKALFPLTIQSSVKQLPAWNNQQF